MRYPCFLGNHLMLGEGKSWSEVDTFKITAQNGFPQGG